MNIKVKDYIKHTEGDDWERVNLVSGHDCVFTDEQGIFTILLKNITDVLPYGEYVEVRNGSGGWKKRIFITYNKGFDDPFMCVTLEYEEEFKNKRYIHTNRWTQARPIKQVEELTLEKLEDNGSIYTNKINEIIDVIKELKAKYFNEQDD